MAEMIMSRRGVISALPIERHEHAGPTLGWCRDPRRSDDPKRVLGGCHVVRPRGVAIGYGDQGVGPDVVLLALAARLSFSYWSAVSLLDGCQCNLYT